jgi:hypothetical protein
MLPAPASIAATPSPRSSVSWNPAVPPPPVTGAAPGIGLADEVAGAVAVLVTVAVAVGVTDPGELELTPGVLDAVELSEADVVPGEGVRLEEARAETDPLAETVTDGEKIAGVVGDDDEVHAETATGASRVRAAQPTAVSLAPRGVPAIVLHTFMDSPRVPGNGKHATGLVVARAATGKPRKRRRP